MRCTFNGCSLLGVYPCPCCKKFVCEQHKNGHAWASQSLPKREYDAYVRGVYDAKRFGWCQTCQALYGQVQVQALPARPEFPASAAGVLWVYKQLPTWYTEQEIERAIFARGGYQAILRQAIPFYHRFQEKNTDRKTRHQAVTEGALVKVVHSGGSEVTMSAGAGYFNEYGPDVTQYFNREVIIIQDDGNAAVMVLGKKGTWFRGRVGGDLNREVALEIPLDTLSKMVK